MCRWNTIDMSRFHYAENYQNDVESEFLTNIDVYSGLSR
jgi:hypothetical protein